MDDLSNPSSYQYYGEIIEKREIALHNQNSVICDENKKDASIVR